MPPAARRLLPLVRRRALAGWRCQRYAVVEGWPFSARTQPLCTAAATRTASDGSRQGLGALLGVGEAPPSLTSGAESWRRRRFVFVGGKGGVGKTTTAAALAVHLAAAGHKTLVVSTDPAHSLGDALAVDLAGGEPRHIAVRGGSSALHALEINPAETVEHFRRTLRLDQLRAAISEKRGGLGVGVLAALAQAGVDLEVLVSLLELSPPGIDEAVALGQLMQMLGDTDCDFERIVIDTAPTGHTLRLLAFPRFLHDLIGTLLSINAKVSGIWGLGGLLDHVVGDDLQQQLQVSKANLERVMAAMATVSNVLADADVTKFLVVAIPTHLAVAESCRLLSALEESKMPARYVVMNQCPFIDAKGGDNDRQGETSEALASAVAKACKGRQAIGLSDVEVAALERTTERLRRQHAEARRQMELLVTKAGPSIRVVCAPVFEDELTGVEALRRYAEVICAE